VNRLVALLVATLVLVFVGLAIWQGLEHDSRRPPEKLSIRALLNGSGDGFLRPSGDWSFRFPCDHSAHSGFRSEIWSIKGHFRDRQAQYFGFQLVLLRLALKPGTPQRESAWAANQVYAAQFALTDWAAGQFETEERISRAALGLSGASEEPVRVWVEDWSLAANGEQILHLHAAMDGYALRLDLRPDKPLLKQGELGLNGLGAGGGFHFYLMPRLDLTGTLWLDEDVYPVSGHAWLDHAWGDVSVARGQVAMDRFSLQFEDGRDLLCLRLHRRDGSGTPIPSCVLIGVDGAIETFRRRDIRLEPDGFWASPVDGAKYPIAWDLSLPRVGLDLAIRSPVRDQELDLGLRAWRGAVELEGREANGRLLGRGFVELTGYAKGNQRVTD